MLRNRSKNYLSLIIQAIDKALCQPNSFRTQEAGVTVDGINLDSVQEFTYLHL